MEIIGTIQKSDLAIGTWTLVSEQNVTYEIRQPVDKSLLQEGLKVKVLGMIRSEVMTIGMVGEVLEVGSFSIL